MPATGLRRSPCNSATSQKALAAAVARSGVPGLDMSRVNMGYDDDEDTEDDPTGKIASVQKHIASMQGSEGMPSGEMRKADVPQLDMSALQQQGASSSVPSK